MAIKTCQNCARASSSTTTAVFPYYCFAHRLYVNPSGCCPMHIPINGYEDKQKTDVDVADMCIKGHLHLGYDDGDVKSE